MHTIKVIDKIDATHIGPVSYCHDLDTFQEVFLSQGSLDGACGHYCLFMSLLVTGVISRSEAINALASWKDGRTNLGRLVSRVKDYRFFHGTFHGDIKEIFDGCFTRLIKVDSVSGSGTVVRNFVIDHVKQDHPVMLGLSWPSGAHWVLVVGLDYAGEGDEKELCRFLVIDPGGDKMQHSAWNGVFSVKGSGGQYPYDWWGRDEKVKFEEAVAIKYIG